MGSNGYRSLRLGAAPFTVKNLDDWQAVPRWAQALPYPRVVRAPKGALREQPQTFDRRRPDMYTNKTVTVLAVALLAVSATAVRAQNNASISATASVQQPITVTAGNALAFGNVFPGIAATVGVASANAGTLSGAGQGSAAVSMIL